MAVLNANALTLIDVAKRMDPDGKVPKIVEMLAQRNDILQDMAFVEGNLPTGHRTTMRTGLPAVYWRLLNQGIAPSKSTTVQADEACGILEAWSEVDVALAELNGNSASFRLSEADAFLEAMSQEFSQTVFYGNASVSPEEFTGLAVRYSSLSASVPSSRNVVNAGGTGSDQSSIWLIVWGDQSCHGIFPKGSKAGLSHRDLGEQTVPGSTGIAGSRLRAYQDQFVWKGGIALKDWRYVVRVANVDIGNLVANSSPPSITASMIRAMHRVPSLQYGRAAFYMNRTCFQYLDLQRRTDVINGGGLDFTNVDGKPIYAFRGVPVRIVDQLLETEAQVS